VTVDVNDVVPALDANFLPVEDKIANAVFNATGRRVTDLPITVEKLL
jgi:xanthine dehydrogenase YagR molybdenum-binding subunit